MTDEELRGYFLCPACGWDGLDVPPNNTQGGSSYEICSCCWIQFGNDDVMGSTYKAWRERWIRNGMRWHSCSPPPSDWDPNRQLARLHEHLRSESKLTQIIGMETLYVFTAEPTGLYDLDWIARTIGYFTQHFVEKEGDRVHTWYWNIYFGVPFRTFGLCDISTGLSIYDQDFWQWSDYEIPEDTDRPALSHMLSLDPGSSFLLSYRPYSWYALKPFLKEILEKFGGWIVSERDDAFIYDLSNLHTLNSI